MHFMAVDSHEANVQGVSFSTNAQDLVLVDEINQGARGVANMQHWKEGYRIMVISRW